MSQVQDNYRDEEFEELLGSAEVNAANDWETTFVSDMNKRWEKYGRRMFLSEVQREHLERIAENS
nr:hypothetical protein 20 [bacterium]